MQFNLIQYMSSSASSIKMFEVNSEDCVNIQVGREEDEEAGDGRVRVQPTPRGIVSSCCNWQLITYNLHPSTRKRAVHDN